MQRGKKRFTTIADEAAARPAALVERRFVASRPNELWLADITYALTWDGWLYVAFILDVHSRMIVGRQLADHLRTDLVLDALEMALWRRDLTIGALIHHSDHGSIHELPLFGSARRSKGRGIGRFPRRQLRQRAWPNCSTARSKAELVNCMAYGAVALSSRSRSSSRSTGTTPPDCTARSATSHPPSSKPIGTVTTDEPKNPSPPNPRCTRPRGGSPIGSGRKGVETGHHGQVEEGLKPRCSVTHSGYRIHRAKRGSHH